MPRPGHEAEIRVRVRRNPRRFFRKLLFLVILLYVVFAVYGFARDMVVARLARAERVQEGTVCSMVPAKAVLVRNEKVVTAPRSGTLRVIASEGERVRVGQVVAQVVTASLDSETRETTFNITSPVAGIVSYSLDGLENVLSPEAVRELDLTKIDTIKSETRRLTAGCRVEEGKPVFRIVNNLDPIILLVSAGGSVPDRQNLKYMLISVGPGEEDVMRASIIDSNFRGRADRLILGLSNYSNDLMTVRRLDFQIITDRYSGFVVPLGAIVRKDGRDGIYTVYKERVKWKAVEVTGQAQRKAVIAGVTQDTTVILNPSYVKEGDPFKLP